MKNALVLLGLALALSSCGNNAPVSPSETTQQTMSPMEAPVAPESYAEGTTLGQQGWDYIAPGVAVSKQAGGYVGYVSVSEINEETLPTLRSYAEKNPSIDIYGQLEEDITREMNDFANGDVEALAAMAISNNTRNLSAQARDAFDWGTSWRTGCSGAVSAIPMTNSRNVKTYAEWSCGKTYIGVVELRVTKGNVPRTAYLARKGQSAYEFLGSDQLPASLPSTYCKANALLRIVNPNSVRIANEVNIGGNVKVLDLNYKRTSEVTVTGGATAFIRAPYNSSTCQ